MKQKAVMEKESAPVEVREGERPGRMARARSVAKIGMGLSLGALFATGLMRGRGAKTLHIWSAVALVGFSVWHHNLYQPPTKGN